MIYNGAHMKEMPELISNGRENRLFLKVSTGRWPTNCCVHLFNNLTAHGENEQFQASERD